MQERKKQTMGFFQQNLVSEYTYPQSVADGVNVDFEVYRIKTEISDKGATIPEGFVVPIKDKKTRRQRPGRPARPPCSDRPAAARSR